MNRLSLPVLALASALLTIGVGRAAPVTVDAAAVDASLDSARAGREAAHLLDLARRHGSAELEAALDRILANPEVNPVTRESTLYRFVIGTRALPPDSVPESALRRLSKRPVAVLTPQPESRGDFLVPLYDVAGAARGSLEMLAMKRASGNLLAALRASPEAFWGGLSEGKAAVDGRALASALEQLDPDGLRAQAQAAGAALERRHSLAPAVAVVALGARDEELTRAVILQADAGTALRVVRQAPSRFDGSGTLRLMDAAASRRQLASSAVLGIGAMAAESAAARQWLLERLDDPVLGESVAVALSRLGEPTIVAWVADGLVPGTPLAGLRHRLLFLQLDGGARARQALAGFAADPAMPASLRREVREWL